MRVLYLSKNVDNYKSANYQKEFLDALSKITHLFVHISIRVKQLVI